MATLTYVHDRGEDLVYIDTGYDYCIVPWSKIEELIKDFAEAKVEERNARVQKLLKEIEDERDEI